MSGDISGGATAPTHFDIKIPGAAKGPAVGYNLADAIVGTLKEILDKYKNSLEGQNKQIAAVKSIAVQIANIETLLSDIGTLEGETDPQGLADQINTGCNNLLATIQEIDNPEARTELTEQVKSIQAMLSSGGALAILSNITTAMKGFEQIMNEIVSGAIGPNDLSALKDLYNDYQVLNGAVGYKGKNSTLLQLIDALNKLNIGINTAPLMELYTICNILLDDLNNVHVEEFEGREGYQAIYLSQAMQHWAEGDKGTLEQFVNNSQGPYGVEGWSQAQKMLGSVINLIPAIEGMVKFTSGEIVEILNAMINNTYGMNAGTFSAIWEAYTSATTSANNIVSQTSQLSNQQATRIQASMTAMQSLIQSMEKDLQVPIQLVNRSISGIL